MLKLRENRDLAGASLAKRSSTLRRITQLDTRDAEGVRMRGVEPLSMKVVGTLCSFAAGRGRDTVQPDGR